MTRDDPAAFAPPPAFGPFRVLHQIGIGALGPVFRTYEPTRDRLVAVKLFRLDITPEQAQSLAGELARACDAALFHPSIVEPIAAGVEGTAAYRAEEYVAAESLDVAMRHYAPAPLEKVLPFITQLAGAIDFARAAGVGHGGLHLRDVFVTPEEARASGFGIVESLERVGIRAPVRRPYSAPERIAGAAWSTPADVFSLAAIAYELLTARRPSGTGDQIGALAGENIGGHAAAVREVLTRAMDEHPGRRYSSALAFASAIEAAARGGVTDRVPAVGAITGGADQPPRYAESAGADQPPLKLRRSAEALAKAEAPAYTESVEPKPQLERAIDVPEPIDVAPAPVEEKPAELGDEAAPTLFDAAKQEPLDDFAIDEPPFRAAEPPKWQYEPAKEAAAIEAHEPFTEPERPRIAMLPVALGVMLGLLIGFAGGYAVGGRDQGGAPQTAAVAGTSTPPASAMPSTSQPQRSGRAWSEQAVAQPSTPANSAGREGPSPTPPPVPGDGPVAATPAAPAPRVTHGSIRVESTPKNAPVLVNGKWRGRTPLTIDDLAFGTHTIRIVQPGFTVARQEVTLSKAQPSRTLTFELQRPGRPAAASPTRAAPAARAGFMGSLFVASNPPGARVFVDGRPFGTAPARIPDIAAGSHVVRLELPDHRVWATSTSVVAGKESRITGSLERIQ